ncbi:MAG: class I SAM-dependent methyltransferase [Nocardioides sp.]
MTWWTEHVVPRVTDIALRGREIGESRVRACAGLSGRVLEIGFGSGLNLLHLPAEVTGIGAVEPSDLGWSMSDRRRARSEVPVDRIGVDGQQIEAPDASYDAALCTFTLCTIPDPLAALAEVRRVVRPGGTLHFLEHGRSHDPGVARWQRRLDPLQQRVAGGCHLTRDAGALVEQAGMRLRSLETGALPGFSGPAALTFGYLGVAAV